MTALFSIDTKDLKKKQYQNLKKPAKVRYPNASEDKVMLAVLKKALMK